MKSFVKIYVLLFGLVLAGCIAHRQKIEWFSMGPTFKPVKAANVEIFKSKSEIKRPWGSIGIIHSRYVAAENEKAVKREIDRVVSLAAANGANAVIIRKVDVTNRSAYAGEKYLTTPHIYIYATAIKYADNLTPEEKNAIEKWEADTRNL
jgi:hypothetical protein